MDSVITLLQFCFTDDGWCVSADEGVQWCRVDGLLQGDFYMTAIF